MGIIDLIIIAIIFLLGAIVGAAARPAVELRYRRAFTPCGTMPPPPSASAPWPPAKYADEIETGMRRHDSRQQFARPPIDGDIRQRGGDLYVSLRDRNLP